MEKKYYILTVGYTKHIGNEISQATIFSDRILSRAEIKKLIREETGFDIGVYSIIFFKQITEDEYIDLQR